MVMSFVGIFVAVAIPAWGCSNFMVPAGSSADGSTILAYNADSPSQVGALSHWPKAIHADGELRPIYSWDDGTYLGAIPQPSTTYNVVGNTNEHQLTITETTFGGLSALDGSGGRAVCDATYGCLDYGQLIWVTLARAKTAREAMATMDELMQTYGYASSGESFSIADPKEVWLMEVIGKGNMSKGSVWVATRIPDGSVCAHANQARTRHFFVGEAEKFRYAHDVVDFARSLHVFQGVDSEFSFVNAFDPVSPYGARTCEARVYAFFRRVAAQDEDIDQYIGYVRGLDLKNHMPLYVKAAYKVSVNDTFWLMRDHYEDSVFEERNDIGAGNWRSPTRLGSAGKVWTFGKARYINERPIGVAFTHWNLVATQRPRHRFGVLWFGVDDSTFTVRAPFYGTTSKVPLAWDDSNCTQRDDCRKQLGLPGTVRDFSFQSMHWVTNMVANYAYSRFDEIAPAVYRRLAAVESRLLAEVAAKDLELEGMEREEAAAAAAKFSFNVSESLHQEWLAFYGELFATYVDGYTTKDAPGTRSGFSKQGSNLRDLMKAEIAEQTGSKYRLPGTPGGHEVNLLAVMDKRCLKSMGGCGDVDGDSTDSEDDASGSFVLFAALLSSLGAATCALLAPNFRRRAAPTSLAEPLALSTANHV